MFTVTYRWQALKILTVHGFDAEVKYGGVGIDLGG